MYPILFSVVLGFTNGLFGSVPMISAPSRVGREHREIAGTYTNCNTDNGDKNIAFDYKCFSRFLIDGTGSSLILCLLFYF